MQCVIHKYAETLEDIEKLEGVIGLQQAITARQYQDKFLINQGINQGRRDMFVMALCVKRKFGLDEAVNLSGFSKEELENEKLNI